MLTVFLPRSRSIAISTFTSFRSSSLVPPLRVSSSLSVAFPPPHLFHAVAMSSMSLAEYDALIYPGFLRRNVARWNDDGSPAPPSRVRGPKNETFVLPLRSGEIDQDVSAIEQEVRETNAFEHEIERTRRSRSRARGMFGVTDAASRVSRLASRAAWISVERERCA